MGLFFLLLMDFKKEIASLVASGLGVDFSVVFDSLEVPKDSGLGDFALPCFFLAKELKKAPGVVAKESAGKLKSDFFVVESVGPYLNFRVRQDLLVGSVLNGVVEPLSFSVFSDSVGIESPAPNSNKPLHLGHLRNMLIGLSLKRIYEKVGKKVVWFDVVNDRGVHICKSMLAYKLVGDGSTPESVGRKSDHFVGDFYVKFSELVKDDPSLEDAAKEMLRKWEAGDLETLKLWRLMRSWWLKGVEKTYSDFGVVVDSRTFESDIYKEGKGIVLSGLKKGLFEKDESGAVFVDLSDKGLDKKYLLRSDGTSIYITQDIFLAKKRFEDFELDEFSYVVGSEQIYHFKALFEIFKVLGFSFWDKCKHISYGMIALPSGRMKSREGTVVDIDDFKADMLVLVEEELKRRYPNISSSVLEERKEVIATGAINFFILKFDSKKDFTYFPDQSLSFHGESGPYVQYTHARICSILRKESHSGSFDGSSLSLDSERKIVNKLREYEEVVVCSAKNNRPSLVAVYLLELSQLFNSYYQDVPVLKASPSLKNARLFLIDKVRVVISDGLSLLGIVAPEEM